MEVPHMQEPCIFILSVMFFLMALKPVDASVQRTVSLVMAVSTLSLR